MKSNKNPNASQSTTHSYDERFTRWSVIWTIVWVALSLAMWFKLIPGFAAGLALILLFWKPLRDSLYGARRRWKYIVRMIVIVTVISFLATVVMQVVQPIIAQLAGIGSLESMNSKEWMQRLREAPWLFVLVTFVGPLGEELSYRYGVFRLVSKWNVVVAHLTTALLFGLQHIIEGWLGGYTEQLLLIPGYMVSSIIWTVAYRRTGNLMVSYGAHVLVNGIPLALMLLLSRQ